MTSNPSFETTHWSIVIAAGDDDARGHAALQDLCRRYWLPLYGFVRRRGHSEHDALDLTQGFFQHVLEKGAIGAADRERGRFRSFLLGALKNYLANAQAHQKRKKRGGGVVTESLDLRDAEGQLIHQPIDEDSPDKEFHRRWAVTVLDRVLAEMQQQYEAEGKGELFAAVKCYLSIDSDQHPYAHVAKQFDMKEANVKVVVHRMRKRYRSLLETEIAATVSSIDDVESEIHELFAALGP